MSSQKVARRQFLRGAGGFALGIPFLPSLAPRALGATPAVPPRFVAFSHEHGGIFNENMYPPDGVLTKTATAYGWQIQQGNLAPTVSGGQAVLSPVLSAPSTTLTAKLASKMNVLRGFDLLHDIGHNGGGRLGNAADCDQGPSGVTIQPMPTIDQVMAYSKSFYADTSAIKVRSVVTGHDIRGISWGYSNPSSGSGPIQKVSVESDSLTLFNQLVGKPSQPTTTPRKPIIDLVLADYNRVMNGSSRISTEDKRRLSDHVARLNELERQLTVQSQISCGSVAQPSESSTKYNNDINTDPKFYTLINDVLAAAFACGSTRIATIHVLSVFIGYSGDWHQEIAHNWTEPDPQDKLTRAGQGTFQNSFLDLISKLDSIDEGNGTTVLDNSLVVWNQESGQSTHDFHSPPVITGGSAGGYFKTGLYCDYRNRAAEEVYGPDKAVFFSSPKAEYPGLTYRQLLANFLMGVGVPPSEFEKNGVHGYGDPYVQKEYAPSYPTAAVDGASDPLPFIVA